MKESEVQEIISKWVTDTKREPLTRTQNEFAHFLIRNKEYITSLGDLDGIFISLRRYLKDESYR